MNQSRRYTFQEDLAKRLKDPDFRKEWEATEPEHNLARQIIEARLKQNLSQRDLAARVLTSQAIVSRIESGSANTSIALIKRFAKALNTPITICIPPTVNSVDLLQAEKSDLQTIQKVTKILANVRRSQTISN